VEFDRDLQFVLHSAVDGTFLSSIPFGERIHGGRTIDLDGVPIERAQGIVEDLVRGGYVDIVRWTPDGEITLTRADALTAVRNRRSWVHDPSSPPAAGRLHEIYLTESGAKLYEAVIARLGLLYSFE
jgi:hypothetical protein